MSWKEFELKDVAKYRTAKIETNLLNEKNYISTENMISEKGGVVNSSYPPSGKTTSSFKTDDILVSNIRPYFKKIWFAKNDGGCSNDVIVFNPETNKVIPEFLYYQLSKDEFFDYMMSGANGTKMPRGNKKAIPKFKLLIPKTFETQKHIASILSNYDDLIENNLRRIKLLEETAQNIYKEWFVNFRFPNYEHTEFDVESGLPVGWEMKKLSELVILTMGQSPKSEFYNENKEGLPFHQGVTGYGHRFVSHSTYCSVVTRIAEEGDILFSVRAPVGRLNIAPEKLIIGRGLSAIRNKRNCQSFQLYQLKNHFFQEDLIGGGAIFNSVTKNDLENQLMILPLNEVVDEFERIIKPIDEQIWKLNLHSQNLKEALDILLPRLMNRTIEV
ncbi:restriction endonuclease subunit S [Flavobacterium sp. Arc3]|uniref:restriction endonuclease subunit S n=1 Tax=Flavobacterium sp. Arc3 TaxID=3046686 RepID=UPI00352E14C6